MLIEVKAILSDGTIIIKKLDNQPLPEERKKYTIWFETIEPDPIPEFNQ